MPNFTPLQEKNKKKTLEIRVTEHLKKQQTGAGAGEPAGEQQVHAPHMQQKLEKSVDNATDGYLSSGKLITETDHKKEELPPPASLLVQEEKKEIGSAQKKKDRSFAGIRQQSLQEPSTQELFDDLESSWKLFSGDSFLMRRVKEEGGDALGFLKRTISAETDIAALKREGLPILDEAVRVCELYLKKRSTESGLRKDRHRKVLQWRNHLQSCYDKLMMLPDQTTSIKNRSASLSVFLAKYNGHARKEKSIAKEKQRAIAGAHESLRGMLKAMPEDPATTPIVEGCRSLMHRMRVLIPTDPVAKEEMRQKFLEEYNRLIASCTSIVESSYCLENGKIMRDKVDALCRLLTRERDFLENDTGEVRKGGGSGAAAMWHEAFRDEMRVVKASSLKGLERVPDEPLLSEKDRKKLPAQMKGMEEQKRTTGALATDLVARLAGAETEFAAARQYHVAGKNGTEDVVACDKPIGISLLEAKQQAADAELEIVYSTQALIQMGTIQMIDFICGQTQRGDGNLHVEVKEVFLEGERYLEVQKVQAGNSEFSFGTASLEEIRKESRDTSCCDPETDEGYPMFRDYDHQTADRILELDPGVFREQLTLLGLNEERCDRALERLDLIKRVLNKDKDPDGQGYRRALDKKKKKIEEAKTPKEKKEAEEALKSTRVIYTPDRYDRAKKRTYVDRNMIRDRESSQSDLTKKISEVGDPNSFRLLKRSKEENKSYAEELRKRYPREKYGDDFHNILDKIVEHGNILTSAVMYTLGDEHRNTYHRERELAREIRQLLKARIDLLKERGMADEQAGEYLALLELSRRMSAQMDGELDVEAYDVTEFRSEGQVTLVTEITKENTKPTEENKISNKYGVRDETDMPLFSHEPMVGDISQGHLGDCYFLAALAAVVDKDPGFIKRHMRDLGTTVAVRLYHPIKGTPIHVEVKKEVFTDKEDEEMDVFARGALWVQLYERAFIVSGLADTFSSFQGFNTNLEEQEVSEARKKGLRGIHDIDGGTNEFAMTLLTGQRPKEFQLAKDYGIMKEFVASNRKKYAKDFQKFCQKVEKEIRKATDEGKIITASTFHDYGMGSLERGGAGENFERGVFGMHSYTVLGLDTIDGKTYVRLRNPHGQSIATYVRSPRTGKMVLRKSGEDGSTFRLTIEDFVERYRKFTVMDGVENINRKTTTNRLKLRRGIVKMP